MNEMSCTEVCGFATYEDQWCSVDEHAVRLYGMVEYECFLLLLALSLRGPDAVPLNVMHSFLSFISELTIRTLRLGRFILCRILFNALTNR